MHVGKFFFIMQENNRSGEGQVAVSSCSTGKCIYIYIFFSTKRRISPARPTRRIQFLE